LANNPFDPQLIQIRKTLNRGGLGTVNRGFGSMKTTPVKTRPAPPGEGGGGASTLAGLTDVDIETDPVEIGETLVWDGEFWVPGSGAGTTAGRNNNSVVAPTDGASATITLSEAPIPETVQVFQNGLAVASTSWSLVGTALTIAHSTSTQIQAGDLFTCAYLYSVGAAALRVNKDRRWYVGSGEVSIDEFDDGVIDGAWVRAKASGIPALPSLANPTYTEDGDVLSVKYGPMTGVGNGTADGATARHTGFVRPLASIGGALAVGDAIVTAFTPLVRGDANYRMSGLIYSTSGLDNAGAQLYYRWWFPNTVMRSMTGWAGDVSPGGGSFVQSLAGPLYQRIVRVSATTWRGDLSPDGVSWIHGDVVSTWAFDPTHVGFAESNWNTTVPSVTAYEFIRRVSGIS
jgi:hypothetical protein